MSPPFKLELFNAPKVVLPAQSKGAASIELSSSGIGVSTSILATIYSAYPPSIERPVTRAFSQEPKSPLRQALQWWQWPPCHPIPTLCPTFQYFEAEPNFLMLPTTSWPGILG